VTLMGDIYRSASEVLIWLGEASDLTGEAFNSILTISTMFDDGFWKQRFRALSLNPNGDYGKFNGQELNELSIKPSWIEVLDFFDSKTYFSRLWIIQEIVLSSKSTVICGSYQITWKSFIEVFALLWQCRFFFDRGYSRNRTQKLSAIFKLALFQNRDNKLSLSGLIDHFSTLNEATDPRDRIYGLLGMLPDGPQKSAISVDYRKSIGEVYREATEAVIEHENSLMYIWASLNSVPDIRPSPGSNSWIPDFGEKLKINASILIVPVWDPWKIPGQMHISAGVLTAYGVFIDSVTYTFPNFQQQNIRSTVEDALGFIEIDLNEVHDSWETSGNLKSLWQALVGYVPAKYPDEFENRGHGFRDLISHWKDPLLQPLTSSAENYMKRFQNICIAELGLGRNLYQTCLGIFGIGPFGKVLANGEPAVRVGDCIAIVATALHPVILRPHDDGTYTLVGNAGLGGFGAENKTYFPDGFSTLESYLEPIRIR